MTDQKKDGLSEDGKQLTVDGTAYSIAKAGDRFFFPQEAVTALHKKTAGLQNRLEQIEHAEFVRGARPEHLVYIANESFHALGVVRENNQKNIILDEALVIDRDDYTRLREQFVGEWYKKDGSDAAIEKPLTPVSLALFLYLTKQDITGTAKTKIVLESTKKFFKDKNTKDDNLNKEGYDRDLETFHKSVTKDTAARDIVDGVSVSKKQMAVNLSKVGRIEKGEVYQTIEALWNLYQFREKGADALPATPQYDIADLRDVAEGPNGHATAARSLLDVHGVNDLPRDLDDLDLEGRATRVLQGGEAVDLSSEAEVIEELTPVEDGETKKRTKKGWEDGSHIDNNYETIGEKVNSILMKREGKERRIYGPLKPIDRVYKTRKERDIALSAARIAAACITQNEWNVNSALSDTLADVCTLITGYIGMPANMKPEEIKPILNKMAYSSLSAQYGDKFSKAAETAKASGVAKKSEDLMKKIKAGDVKVSAEVLRQYFQDNAKEIKIDWLGTHDFERLGPKPGEVSDIYNVLTALLSKIDPEHPSDIKIVDWLENVIKYAKIAVTTEQEPREIIDTLTRGIKESGVDNAHKTRELSALKYVSDVVLRMD